MSNSLETNATLPVVMLMGPTASGKTAATLALAEQLPLEIISVDSAQVYRGMDIGTAKPSAAIRDRVPHHLIDILDPSASYSAAQFAADARRLIAEIRGRGRIPVLAGGTMLYFRALSDGLSALPPADPAVRARLEAEALQSGWPAMHARLRAIDPEAAARLHPNDQQRIQRALEIHEISGMTQSALHAQPREAHALGRVLMVALSLPDRRVLHARIERRFREMMTEGFLEEVRRLHGRGDLRPDMPSMRAVGYRQLWAYLDGEGSLEEAVEKGIAATRQYAKRQLTWLRGNNDVRLFDAEDSALVRLLRDEIRVS